MPLLLCGLTLTAGVVEAQLGCDPLPAPQGTVIDVYPAQATSCGGSWPEPPPAPRFCSTMVSMT